MVEWMDWQAGQIFRPERRRDLMVTVTSTMGMDTHLVSVAVARRIAPSGMIFTRAGAHRRWLGRFARMRECSQRKRQSNEQGKERASHGLQPGAARARTAISLAALKVQGASAPHSKTALPRATIILLRPY